jgi:hypothetical protein
MSESIYKINKLEFNSSNSQFCLAYNDGIKSFNTETFKELYKCKSLGAVSMAVLFHELSIAIFVGTENNELFNNKKVCIYDLINQKLVLTSIFKNEILSLKIVDKYLVVGFKGEIKIFSLEKRDTILPVKEMSLPESDLHDIWDTKTQDIIPQIQINLAYVFQKEICINSFTCNDWNDNSKLDIKIPISKVQNLFFIKKLNQILVPDETAKYIYGFDVKTGKQTLLLYRGEHPGVVTSITMLNKNYLALNNINRKIYIYDLSSSQGVKMIDWISSYFYGNYIKAIMKISYDEIIKDKEGDFYKSDFLKKGSILSGEEEGIHLRVISYNGYAYKLKIGFLKKEYELVTKEQIADYKEEIDKELTLVESNSEENEIAYNSIFEKEKKNKKDNE